MSGLNSDRSSGRRDKIYYDDSDRIGMTNYERNRYSDHDDSHRIRRCNRSDRCRNGDRDQGSPCGCRDYCRIRRCDRSDRRRNGDCYRNSQRGRSYFCDRGWRTDCSSASNQERFQKPNDGGSDNARGTHESRGNAFIPVIPAGENRSTDPSPDTTNVIDVDTSKDTRGNWFVLNVSIAKPVYHYEVKIEGFEENDDDEGDVDMYKTPIIDGARNAKYNDLTEVFETALSENRSFFKTDEKDETGNPKHIYIFDGSRNFYTNLNLIVDDAERVFTIDKRLITFENCDYYEDPAKILQIRLVKVGFLDPANVFNQRDAIQRQVFKYLDILFDHIARKNGRYYVFKNRMFLKDDNEQISGPNCILKRGFRRRISIIDKDIVLQYDREVACFLPNVPLLQFLNNNDLTDVCLKSSYSTKRIQKLIRGFHVRTTHTTFNSSFVVHKITDQPGTAFQYHYEGRIMNFVDMFEMQFDQYLKHPEYLCVDNHRNLNPFETLEVVGGQRIPARYLSLRLREKMFYKTQMNSKDFVVKADAFSNADDVFGCTGIFIKN